MKLEIKYELGEKVYAVYKEYDGIIRIIKSEIEEIKKTEAKNNSNNIIDAKVIDATVIDEKENK